MTETQSSVFPENLQESAHPHDEQVTVTLDEAKAKVEREPRYKLIALDAGLANIASLLHVAYKSAAFENNDYQEEIFNKSIGNGGDQVLLQRILDEVELCHEQVMDLRLQITGGVE
jgi:hypothetical protein